MLINDVITCAFPNWYPLFTGYTVSSIIINLQNDFIEYMNHDNIFLPRNHKILYSSDYSDESDEEVSNMKKPYFPALERQIKDAIDGLGGVVFPKLDWSAPKDAAWMNFGQTLQCRSASEIFLLLKASDFISHDLNAAFEMCSDVKKSSTYPHSLILREWKDYNPAGEFRCFVKSRQLKGISQRKHDAYFAVISEKKSEISDALKKFIEKNIHEMFPLSDYVVDLYYDYKKKRVEIIDFNVYGPPTDSLLISYDALSTKGSSGDIDLEFKFQTNPGVKCNEMSQYKVPVDFVEMTSGKAPHKVKEFLEFQKNFKL